MQERLFDGSDGDRFVTVGGRRYPTTILGGDRFLPFWGEQKNSALATTEGVLTMMGKAYELGVRGFDISLGAHVIEAFNRLKRRRSDAIGIGNPNWRCGIKIGGKLIDEYRDRVVVTIRTHHLTHEQRESVNRMGFRKQARWLLPENDAVELTEDEVESIHLDEGMYRAKLAQLKGLVDFVLVGTNYADWLVPLGKMNILARMSRIVRDSGFIPLSISHWASMTLPVLDAMDFEGHWVLLNRNEQFFNATAAEKAVRNAHHPVTAFRTLAGGALVHDMRGAFDYLKRVGIESVVVGADNAEQLEATIPIVNSVMGIQTGEAG